MWRDTNNSGMAVLYSGLWNAALVWSDVTNASTSTNFYHAPSERTAPNVGDLSPSEDVEDH